MYAARKLQSMAVAKSAELRKNDVWAIMRCHIAFEKQRIFGKICEYFYSNFKKDEIWSEKSENHEEKYS